MDPAELQAPASDAEHGVVPEGAGGSPRDADLVIKIAGKHQRIILGGS